MYFWPLFLTSIHRYNIGLKFPKFQPLRATITIFDSNSFDLFSYGLESVFWYFQFQGLISDFADNPLKLQKISCRGPQTCSIRDICLPFSKTMEICPFWCEWELISTRYSNEKKNKKQSKKISCKKKGKKKDKKVPWPSSKTAQDILPTSGPPEQRNVSSIFRKKRKIFVFGVNGTSFL